MGVIARLRLVRRSLYAKPEGAAAIPSFAFFHSFLKIPSPFSKGEGGGWGFTLIFMSFPTTVLSKCKNRTSPLTLDSANELVYLLKQILLSGNLSFRFNQSHQYGSPTKINYQPSRSGFPESSSGQASRDFSNSFSLDREGYEISGRTA
jgi:hypothetical protein